jgi:hypothetical protein
MGYINDNKLEFPLAIHFLLASGVDFTFINLNFLLIINHFFSAEIVREFES